jgi:hypothetical protein
LLVRKAVAGPESNCKLKKQLQVGKVIASWDNSRKGQDKTSKSAIVELQGNCKSCKEMEVYVREQAVIIGKVGNMPS